MEQRLPDGLTVEHNLDLHGRRGRVWYRRALLCMIAAFPVLALLNVFGQRPTVSIAKSSVASLKITAPARLRGGLIFQVRAQIAAHRTIAKPQLVFSPGWWESMSVNSIEPNPASESTRNGTVVLSYGKLPAGRTLIVWIYFQVNPTNVGKRREDVELDDGSIAIARVHRALTIFP